jgi:hypothetical protein
MDQEAQKSHFDKGTKTLATLTKNKESDTRRHYGTLKCRFSEERLLEKGISVRQLL